MSYIELHTDIRCPIDICFDLARSIDMHKLSVTSTREVAEAGRLTGLINLGETVTWRATHFGIRQRLSVRIEQMERPRFFSDRMIKGAFRSMYHEHLFTTDGMTTTMTDKFYYETPGGILGRIFDKLVLRRHMLYFLTLRNNAIKTAAENGDWQRIISYD